MPGMQRAVGTVFFWGVIGAIGVGAVLLADARAEDGAAPAKSSSVAPKAPAVVRGWDSVPLPPAVHKGLKWLIVSQHPNGGWSEHGGRPTKASRSQPRGGKGYTPHIPDVGNTSIAALALFEAGNTPCSGTFQAPLRRAVEYILAEVETSKKHGLAITDRTGTQLQNKIGRYADTFLAARVLVRADGQMRTKRENARVRQAVKKVLHKIEGGQSADGSWNSEGGWAPIHSTAYASQALWEAKAAGFDVDGWVLDKVERYTERTMRTSLRPPPKPKKPVKRAGGPVVTPSPGPMVGRDAAGAAGVVLYSISQGIEQLTRTPKARKRYIRQIKDIEARVNTEKVLKGLGSMGGEEFISYTNINLAMARLGGEKAARWNERMKERLSGLQNKDGSWSGHHCITGRTAVTGLAITTLLAERSVPRRD